MTTEVRFHLAALRELRADVAWLDDRDEGLGARLEASIEGVLRGLLGWPESGQLWPGWDRLPEVRSRRIADFPYRLVYCVLDQELVVIAVAHESRRPGYWRDRVDTAVE